MTETTVGVNLAFDSGEQSVGGPRYMQTIATLVGTELKIRTHLVTHITFSGFHGMVTVTLADRTGHAIYVSQPYLDGIGSQFNNPNGRWVEHTETVPGVVADNADRIDILQSWHGVNMLSQDLMIFWKDFGTVIIAAVIALFGGGGGGKALTTIDTAVSTLSQKMTETGHTPVHSTVSGLWHAPAPGMTEVALVSAAFPGVNLRMDGQGITQPNGAGAGTVNCQYGVGPWEKYKVLPVA